MSKETTQPPLRYHLFNAQYDGFRCARLSRPLIARLRPSRSATSTHPSDRPAEARELDLVGGRSDEHDDQESYRAAKLRQL
jgi:hypothetical protein